jgi:tetratricopeptide (TPR) repeat protein
MNRNDFINMMSDTVPQSRQSVGELYELIDIFPYFQSAHLLLVKGLNDLADVKFENQLRSSAIHIANREVLYYLLRNERVIAETQPEIADLKTSGSDTLSETQQNVIESGKNSIDLITEIEYEVSEPVEEKVFYMDPGFSFPESDDLLELDTDEAVTNKIDDSSVEQESAVKGETVYQTLSQTDLIDKFIIANPRIEPNRERTNLPVEDISRPFVEAEGGFVTETLARIYINQGYYSKAVDIYEKLSLKFPEKSSYFASQIEKVKEYINK